VSYVSLLIYPTGNLLLRGMVMLKLICISVYALLSLLVKNA